MPSSQSFPPPLQLAPSAESILVESLDPLAPYPCLPVTHPDSHHSTLFPWVWCLQGSHVAEITHCLFVSLSVLLSWMQDSFPVLGFMIFFCVDMNIFFWFVHILKNICLFPHFSPRIRINTIISNNNIRHFNTVFLNSLRISCNVFWLYTTACIPPTPSRFLPTFFLHSSPGSFKKIKQNYGIQSVLPWVWAQPTMGASLKTIDSPSRCRHCSYLLSLWPELGKLLPRHSC